MWNMFKVNNKNTRTTSIKFMEASVWITVFWEYYLYIVGCKILVHLVQTSVQNFFSLFNIAEGLKWRSLKPSKQSFEIREETSQKFYTNFSILNRTFLTDWTNGILVNSIRAILRDLRLSILCLWFWTPGIGLNS